MTYAYAHAPSREDTRIVKGEKGEYRGERGEGRGRRIDAEVIWKRGKARWKSVDCREERGEYHVWFVGVTCAACLGRSVVHIIRLYTGVEFMPQLSSYMQYYSMVRYFTHRSSLKGVKIQSLNLLNGVYI